jgi:hypothetical protein
MGWLRVQCDPCAVCRMLVHQLQHLVLYLSGSSVTLHGKVLCLYQSPLSAELLPMNMEFCLAVNM